MKTRCCCSKRYLLVFSILLVSVGSIFMSVSLSSCSSPSVKNPLLLCADSLMETYPDSALSILESITYPQKMPRADRALYALLLTQARHKNYIALEDDSLIKTAVDYYGDKKKSLRAAKACLLYTSFILLAIGMAIVIIGFLLMTGPTSSETSFEPDIFSVRRIKVAPVVCLFGFLSMIYAVLRKPKTKVEQ